MNMDVSPYCGAKRLTLSNLMLYIAQSVKAIHVFFHMSIVQLYIAGLLLYKIP